MQRTRTSSVDTERPWYREYGPGVSPDFTPLPERDMAELVRRVAAEFRDGKAFTVCLDNGLDASLSFAEADLYSDRFAGYLRHVAGIQPGDRVAVQMPNCLAYPVAAFGIFKAGAVLVNVNPLYTAPEMHHQLTDAGARVLVIIDMFADKLAEALDGSAVETVVTVSIAEHFPRLKGLLVRGVLKYVRRMIPATPVPVTPFAAALRHGAAHAARVAEEGTRRDPSSTAVLQYTGGTTGVAKGAELTHANLLANIAQIHGVAGQLMSRQDVVLTALPLYHIFAFTFNLMAFYVVGSRNVLCPSPRPPSNLRRAFEKFTVTKFSAVNVLFQGLLRERWFRERPPRAIDLSVSGGTALHRHVAEEWQRVVGSPICEGYGLSETSPVVTVNPPMGEVRLGTIGIPVPGTDVRLVDDDGAELPPGEVGELAVRGPQVMRGYWNQPGETAAVLRDGWLLTGDMARMDERGYLTIVDRKKDMIDVSGFNVYPNEVEDCLGAHPDIDEVAVIGVRQEDGGERVRAYVVTHNKDLTEEQVIAWARKRLTGYKVPKEVVFRRELPKTPVGKILRRALQEEAQEAG